MYEYAEKFVELNVTENKGISNNNNMKDETFLISNHEDCYKTFSDLRQYWNTATFGVSVYGITLDHRLWITLVITFGSQILSLVAGKLI